MRWKYTLVWMAGILLPCTILGQSAEAYFLSSSADSGQLQGGAMIVDDRREVELFQNGRVDLKVKKVILLMEENESLATQRIYYDPDSKVQSFKVDIYDSKGVLVRSLGKKDVLDVSGNSFSASIGDARYQILKAFHNTYPYTIEVEYSLRLDGFAKLQAYQWDVVPGYGVGLMEGTLKVISPKSMNVELLAMNCEGELKESNEGASQIQQYRLESLEPLSYERSGLPAGDLLPKVWVFPDYFSIDKYEGSFKDWESYGQFLHQLTTDRKKRSPEMVAAVKTITQGLTSEAEKISALYAFMQKEMRYVSIQLGIGGWQPHSAEWVFEKKYGDCKALTNYLRTLLLEVGIDSYPVVIYRGDRNPAGLDPEKPTYAFNHMLLYVPKTDQFLECTSNDYPPGFIGYDNENRQALLVKPTGGSLIEMPGSSSRTVQEVQVDLAQDGSAEISLEVELEGAAHQVLRWWYYNGEPNDHKEALLERYDLPAYVLKKWELKPSTELPICRYALDLSVRRFASTMGKRIFLPLNFYQKPIAFNVEDEEREQPFQIVIPVNHSHSFAADIPKGYKVETVPEEHVLIETPFGKLEQTIKIVEGQIRFVRNVNIPAQKISQEQYEDFRSFIIRAQKLEKEQVVLVRSGA